MKKILINNLSKSYRNNKVFSNVNEVFFSDYIYFLTSENGRGKTTFFKCLLKETSFKGDIIDNEMVYSYLPDRVIIPKYVKLKDFIKMYLDIDFKTFYGPIIDDYLMLFDIIKYKNKYMHELSKGTRQKVLIIKTLLSKADVYLFDEPLSGLDLKSRYTFMALVKTLQEQGKIVIIASHYYDEYKFSNKKVIEFS